MGLAFVFCDQIGLSVSRGVPASFGGWDQTSNGGEELGGEDPLEMKLRETTVGVLL